MILTCEKCQAKYTVDGTKLSPGRTVKCTNCGHSWRHEADAATSAAAMASSAMQEAAPVRNADTAGADMAQPAEEQQVRVMRSFARPVSSKSESKSPPSKTLVRAASLAGPVVLLLGGLLYGREQIVETWPPAARFYQSVGLPAAIAAPGLVVRSVEVKTAMENGRLTLSVDGEVANTGAEPHPVGMLRAKLMHGAEVQARWEVDPGTKALEPGKAVKFHTVAPNPSDATDKVIVGLWP